MNPIKKKKLIVKWMVWILYFLKQKHTHTQGRGNVVLTSNKEAYHKLTYNF